MMSPKLNLDSLDVYSSDAERVCNSIKRVIKFSDSEEKLFKCFDFYRCRAVTNDRALWDRNFNHLVKREMGTMHISQDFATKLRAGLDNDVENFRQQHSEGVLADPAATIDVSAQLEAFVKAIEQASKVDEYTMYADMVKAGHDEAVCLDRILDTLWKHQEKHLDVMNDASGNKQLSKLDQRDRVLDFARYMDSRATWFNVERNQAVLKSRLNGPSAKERTDAKKLEKTRKQDGESMEK